MSMSNRWYRSTDTPIAIGIRPNEKTATFCSTRHPGGLIVRGPRAPEADQQGDRVEDRDDRCRRHEPSQLQPLDPSRTRRYRWTSATSEPITPIGRMTMLAIATVSTGRSALDAERVLIVRERATSAPNVPGGKHDGQEDDHQARGDDPREPSPPRRRQVSVREQQQEERHGQRDDRHPHRVVQRHRDEPGLATADAAVDGVAAVRPEEGAQSDRRPDPQHEPAERVVRAAGGHQVPHEREQGEGQQEPHIGGLPVDGGEPQADGGRHDREPGDDAREQDQRACRRVAVMASGPSVRSTMEAWSHPGPPGQGRNPVDPRANHPEPLGCYHSTVSGELAE